MKKKKEEEREREAEELMGVKMMQGHHLVSVRLNEKLGGTKRNYTIVHRLPLTGLLILWLIVVGLVSYLFVYEPSDAETKTRRHDVLVTNCDQRARILQDQFSVSVNHVHALGILVSTFHYYKNPSAIDQVCALFFSLCYVSVLFRGF